MKNTSLAIGLAVLTLLSSPSIHAANTLGSDQGVRDYLVFDEAFAIAIPTRDVTWTVTQIGDPTANTLVRIMDLDGTAISAVKLRTDQPIVGAVRTLPDTAFAALELGDASAQTDAMSSDCKTSVRNMLVCATITYNGGSSPIWHHGSVENVPTNHACLSGTGCLLIQGCTHVSCPNQAWFWVQPTATYASVCWTWRAFTFVNARATYDGVSPSTDDVFPSWQTTC